VEEESAFVKHIIGKLMSRSSKKARGRDSAVKSLAQSHFCCAHRRR